MKIGIVTTWFERGAAYVSKQFKEVWEKEHDIFIYARGGETIAKYDPNWKKGNITYGKRYDYSNLDIIDLVHFEKWITSNNLDIVFFNEQHLWKPVLLCNKLGVKIGSYIDYYTEDTVPLFEAYDFLICNTKRHHSVFNWHPHSYYVPWGTNTNIYNDSQRHKVDKNRLIFFHSAGMNPYRKGTDLVIKAFNKLSSTKSKLIIHTQTKIDIFFPETKSIIKDLIANDKLEIINKTVPAPGLYKLGDIYVYPSRLEGIGLTIAEASACGLPVITTDIAPMNEFVKDGVNGKLVKVESQTKRKDGYYWKESVVDIDDLAKQMQFFIDNLEDIETLKDNSYKYAQDKLSWQKNSIQLTDIILEVSKTDKNVNKCINDEILKYEASRGYWYYLANTKLYQNTKRKLLNIKKRLFL